MRRMFLSTKPSAYTENPFAESIIHLIQIGAIGAIELGQAFHRIATRDWCHVAGISRCSAEAMT